MTQKEKELLMVDLCARLPYGVVVQITSKHSVILGDGNESDESDEPYNVSLTIGDCDSLIDFFNEDWVIGIKPYLRPMSSMTEEEEERKCAFLDDIEGGIEEAIPNYIDWLNKKGFDYRGLIPMRLALPATEGMYETK